MSHQPSDFQKRTGAVERASAPRVAPVKPRIRVYPYDRGRMVRLWECFTHYADSVVGKNPEDAYLKWLHHRAQSTLAAEHRP